MAVLQRFIDSKCAWACSEISRMQCSWLVLIPVKKYSTSGSYCKAEYGRRRQHQNSFLTETTLAFPLTSTL